MSCEQCANINMLIYRMNLNSTASAVLRLFYEMSRAVEFSVESKFYCFGGIETRLRDDCTGGEV